MIHLLISIVLGLLAYVIAKMFLDPPVSALIGVAVGLVYFTQGSRTA